MAELVTVNGRFELPHNAPSRPGALYWFLVPGEVPDLSEPVTVLPGPATVPIGTDGSFTVELRATDDPDLTAHTSGPLTYRVRRHINGSSDTWWSVTVPAPGPWDWSELSPAPAESTTVILPVPGPPGPPGPPPAWVEMTQAAYNALAVKDPLTLYIIIG